MPTILKREYAPISDMAWQAIDEEAANAIKRTLTCRKVVDFNGPHDWQLATVNLGRIESPTKKTGDINWALRQVLQLLEIRQPFTLTQMELDSINRGAADVDLDAVIEVATKAAKFEDSVVYEGFNQANMPGIIKSSEHKPVKLPNAAEQYPQAVSKALKAMSATGIDGPYALVLGPDQYYSLLAVGRPGYPPARIIKEMIKGEILMSSVLTGGLVLSTRGGDFELTVGKDYSVGYASHDRKQVEFFITESFAFRVIEPKAAVQLKQGS